MISAKVLTSLADVKARFFDLVSYEAQQDLFRSIEWFECLYEHGLAAPVEPRVYVAADDAAPGEAAFLFCAREPGGAALTSLSNYYTMEFSVVFAPRAQQREALVAAIFQHIAAERPRWRQVNLRSLREDSPVIALVEDGLRRNGFALNRYFQFENYHIDVKNLDFKSYYEARPSRAKNTIRRREKKLRSEHKVSLVQTDEYAPEHVRDYMKVYDNSWKDGEATPDFIDHLCRLGASLALLRLGLLYVDEIPAAAQIWLKSGPKAIIYKLAYDEKFKDFSVGSILTKEVANFVLSRDRLVELDYGVGSEPYKQEWMDRTRRIVGIEAFNRRSLAGSLGTLRSWARAKAKRLLPERAVSARP
jgi:Acetyltransferase (GNAT) domain